MEEQRKRTEEILEELTSHMETINDPKTIANVAISAILVLVKRLMYMEVKDDSSR